MHMTARGGDPRRQTPRPRTRRSGCHRGQTGPIRCRGRACRRRRPPRRAQPPPGCAHRAPS
eukprot:4138870-Prymnesium_polylepis.1